MDTPPRSDFLRRDTDLPALFYLLKKRKITLLDPKSRDDSNDSYYLLQYKEKKKLKSILALCLTEAEETYHHWRIFSRGTAGVCIHFKREALVAALASVPGIRLRKLDYRRVRDAKTRTQPLKVEELPFIKRAGFSAEEEYRPIYESRTDARESLDVDISVECIRKITLSPWLHPSLSRPVKEAFRAIDGCRSLDIRRSTLVGNSEWKRLGENAA